MTQAGGFESGADYVAARVSFDIDNSGVSSLKELSESLNNFRTATEAANRTGADFLKFLQQMTALTNQANEAQTQLVNTLQRMTDSQQAIMTGQGTQVSRGYPQGRVDPLSGMGGGAGSGMGNRAPTTAGTEGYLDNLAAQDPRKYLNMQSNWGNVRTGDVPAHSPSDNDLAQHAQRHRDRDKAQTDQAVATHMNDPFSPMQRRISGMTSGAAQLLSEISPGGGGGMGMAGMAQQGLMSLSGMLRQSGAAQAVLGAGGGAVPNATATAGGIGSLSGLLGRGAAFLGTGAGMVATGIGAGVGAEYLLQEGGQAVQNYRSMGQIRGGGFQEGLGYEMAIRSMALSPFLSTDQARQIVAQGLSSGYTGKEFDTVTQFMAANLKDMNMSVAESMKIFKKNVVEGGMSQEGLSASLEGLKIGSKSGYSTLAELQGNYADASAALINAGVPGQVASREASTAAYAFNDIADLKGLMSQVTQSASDPESPLAAMMLNSQVSGVNVPPGTDVSTVLESMPGGQTQATYNIMRYWAMRYWQSSGGNRGRAVSAFWGWLKANIKEVNWSNRTQVEKLFWQLISNPNAIAQADAKATQDRKKAAEFTEQSRGSRVAGSLVGGIQSTMAGIVDLGKNLFTRKAGDPWEWKGWNAAQDEMELASSQYRSPVLDNLIRENGADNIEIGDGKNWKALDVMDAQQIAALAAGKSKVRMKGSGTSGTTLSDIPDGGKGFSNSTYGGGANPMSVAPVHGTLTITIDQQGRVSAPPTVDLSPTNAGANEGAGGFSPNNPQPGDRRRRPGE